MTEVWIRQGIMAYQNRVPGSQESDPWVIHDGNAIYKCWRLLLHIHGDLVHKNSKDKASKFIKLLINVQPRYPVLMYHTLIVIFSFSWWFLGGHPSLFTGRSWNCGRYHGFVAGKMNFLEGEKTYEWLLTWCDACTVKRFLGLLMFCRLCDNLPCRHAISAKPFLWTSINGRPW